MNTVAFIRTTNIYDDSRATKEITALSDAGYRVVVLGWDRNGEAEEKTMHLFAGMDVWADEKNLNWELARHPAVSCTPHIGAGTREAQKRIGAEIVDIITKQFNL